MPNPIRPGAPLRGFFIRWLPAVVWLGLVGYLTLTPLPPLPPGPVSWADLVIHVLLFGVLAWLTLRAGAPNAAADRPDSEGLAARARVPARFLGWTLVVLTVAALDEALQSWIPNRTTSWLDLAADAIGILTFAALRLHR